jgi:hypothetical protein
MIEDKLRKPVIVTPKFGQMLKIITNNLFDEFWSIKVF